MLLLMRMTSEMGDAADSFCCFIHLPIPRTSVLKPKFHLKEIGYNELFKRERLNDKYT